MGKTPKTLPIPKKHKPKNGKNIDLDKLQLQKGTIITKLEILQSQLKANPLVKQMNDLQTELSEVNSKIFNMLER